MTAALTMDNQNLVFASSESKAIGLFGSIKKFISDNAPRIVGTMKLAGDIAIGLSMSPWLIGYTAFAGLGRILLMIYGTKENQKKVAAEHKDNPHAQKSGIIEKVLHPKEYPVEASAGLSVIAESLGVGYGISRFLAGTTGYTQMVLGLFAVGSYASILFGKDKKTEEAEENNKVESLVFSQSKSKPMGFIGRIRRFARNHSEVLGNVMLLALTAGLVTGAVIEGYGAAYITGASILLVANTIQALFVRKRKFNIEGAQEDMANKAGAAEPRPANFQERINEQRKDDPGVHLA